MTYEAEYLQHFRNVVRYYEHSDRDVCERRSITQTELDILAFLHNHPGLDTASDIVEYRLLQKSNVSVAVESLIRKGLLVRLPDKSDRRLIHLFLTAAGEAVIPDIERSRRRLTSRLFEGFTEEEIGQYRKMNERIFSNAEKRLKKEPGRYED